MNSLGAAITSAAFSISSATRQQRLLTLIYHRVRPERDPLFPGEVTANEFDWQMGLVARFCRPLPIREAVSRLQSGSLPPRAVAVTFDDGYRDNATVALPMLLRHGVPATFFVATSFLDGGLMWNDVVVEALRSTRRAMFSMPELGIPEVVLDDHASRGRTAEQVIRQIKHMPQPVRAEHVRHVAEVCEASLPRNLMMTTDEVRVLHRAGMEIGAHTQTHPILCTLSPEAARAEIAGSRDTLSGICGEPVKGFAYPNGRPGEDYGPRERQIVESLGFDYAVATRTGVASAASDRFQLPRFTPWDRSPSRWLARLLLHYREVV